MNDLDLPKMPGKSKQTNPKNGGLMVPQPQNGAESHGRK